MYIWLIHGGIDDSTFSTNLTYIPIMFGTILVTIILMNIMIAYLSNEYSRLEEKQHLDDIRGKAQINIKLELIIRYFKLVFNKKFRQNQKFRDHHYANMIKEIMGYELTQEEIAKEVVL
jgi:hypothetical protein